MYLFLFNSLRLTGRRAARRRLCRGGARWRTAAPRCAARTEARVDTWRAADTATRRAAETCTATAARPRAATRAPRAAPPTPGGRADSSWSSQGPGGHHASVYEGYLVDRGTKAGNSNNIVHCSSGEALIDLDGPGPVPAALLSCEMEAGAVITVVPHSSMEPTKVSTQIFLHRLSNIFSAGGRVPGPGLVQPDHPLRGGRGGGQAAGGDRGQLQPAAEVRLPTVPPAGQHLR